MCLLPLQSFLLPDVDEAEHEHAEEHHHLDEAEPAEPPVEGGPWPDEQELDIEEDEEDRDGRKLDGEAAFGQRDRILPAFEGRHLDRGIAPRCDEGWNAE